MPRSNFLSTQFFIPSNEERAVQLLLGVSSVIAGCRFISKAAHQPVVYFLFEQNQNIFKTAINYLPLNEEFTKITIQVAYADGHPFTSDKNCKEILYKLELIISALAKGEAIDGSLLERKSAARLSSLLSYAQQLFTK